jgi:hypothetical protein
VRRRVAAYALGVVGVLVIAAIMAPFVLGFAQRAVRNVSILGSAGVDRARMFEMDAIEARRAQASVPEGEKILVKTVHPFLMDFARNHVLVMDWPHGSSPPPGMPFGRGPDALATYLGDQGIRYVVFEYQPMLDASPVGESWWYAHGDPECRSQDAPGLAINRADRTGESAFECAMDVGMADFLGHLQVLRSTRAARYDDGRVVVMDLATPR